MYNSTWRVVYAIVQLKDTYIQWLDENSQRIESMTNIEREGFGRAVGKIDGTDIVLKYKPSGNFGDGAFWYNWKKRYVVDLCAVCNSRKEIIYFLTG